MNEIPHRDLAPAAAGAMRSAFGLQPRDPRFSVVELALMALADKGALEASSREIEIFEALVEDDPESLLAAVNQTIRQDSGSLTLPDPPTEENLREWADLLVSLVISSYPDPDELPYPL